MSSSAGLGTSATTNADDNFNGSTPNQIANPNATGDSDQTLTNSDNNAGNENLANGTWVNNGDNQNTTTAGQRCLQQPEIQ